MPRRRGLLQIVLVGGCVDAYELARRLIVPDWPAAVGHARELLALERSLHLAWESPLQRAFLGVSLPFDVLYVGAHFVVTGAFFVWLYRRAPEAYARFRDAFVTATALALLVHWRFPVAPPRLAGVGVEDTVRHSLGLDIGSRAGSVLTDPVAAMPSLHAGWALGVGIGIALYGRFRGARVVGVAYPVLVVLATLVTGNHFVLDALAGAVVMGVGLRVSALLRQSEGGTIAAATRGGAVR